MELLKTASRFAEAYSKNPSPELEYKLRLSRYFARNDPNFIRMGKFACRPYDSLKSNGLTIYQYYVLADFTGQKPVRNKF